MPIADVKTRGWKIFVAGLLAVAAASAAAPGAAQNKVQSTHTLPDLSIKEFQNRYFKGSVPNDRKVLLGSVGSDLWHGTGDGRDEFWMLTDRGPNGQIAVDGKNRRTFWVPEFNPAIIKVKAAGDTIRVLEVVPIVGRSGKPVTGLPNLKDIDETPYDYSAREVLPFNPSGLDTEGLVRTAAGEFWIAEEYSPSLVHVDHTGKVIKRYIPEGLNLEGADYSVAAVLPAIYGKRKINRGFEGLALSADQRTLYAVLQSPLLNPDKRSGDISRNTRVLAFDIAAEKVTAEYVYRFDASKEFDPGHSAPDEMKLSGVVALNPTTLLILERTDWVAKLYAVDMSRATDILGSKWDDTKTTPTLESFADPATAQINTLPKSLVVDLSSIAGVPEKVEGIAVLDQRTIAIANDNDFDSEESKYDNAGNNVGKGKKSQILVISLDGPLPLPAAAISAR
ncbi:MAG TPA: esterase-like activity of phytase family protein [Terriglobales bacterium]|nr:esterase-like activity of phytase family protein [Terriglobales bacterium]